MRGILSNADYYDLFFLRSIFDDWIAPTVGLLSNGLLSPEQLMSKISSY